MSGSPPPIILGGGVGEEVEVKMNKSRCVLMTVEAEWKVLGFIIYSFLYICICLEISVVKMF